MMDFTLPAGSAMGRGMLSRIALFVSFLLAGLAGGAVFAQGKVGLDGHNSQAPVDYAADRIELQDKQNRVLLSGNVDIKQDDLRMQAARTLVLYTNDGGVKIQRIDATGSVSVTRGKENATADVANYDFNQQIITLVGNVVLHRDGDVSRGSRLVIDLKAHHTGFVGDGGQAGRVTGSFSVAKRKD
jgi:lipopolysaccharide export system protein LptA